MSLQLAAQHLSHQGRGGDSTLVHMSPREVKSLNDLAMAHGGQLSINPQTGLPEAGFLSSILPMVAGAALTGLSGGAINPMTAGLITGGLGYAMTGSLSKGLMMGLGAYGGGNLGEALATQGMQAAAVPAAADLTSAGAMAQQSALAQQEMIKEAALAAPVEGATKQMMLDNQALAGAGANSGAQLQAVQNAALTPEAAKMRLADMTMGERFNAMKGGIGSLGQEGGLSSLYQNLGGSPMSLLKSIGPAAAPAIGEAMTPKKQEEEKADADMGQRYGFSMNPTGGQRQVQPGQDPLANTQSPTTTPLPASQFDSSEKSYFAPSYTKLTPEQAKSMYGYAEGGAAQANPQPATETPALQEFKKMQAQRAAQPPVQQINTSAQYADYLKEARGTPNQLKAPTAPPPTTTNLADSGFSYDPIAQRYSEIKGTLPADESTESTVGPFNPSGFDRNGRRIGSGSPYDNYFMNTGTNKAAGGLMDAYAGGGMSHLGDYSDGGRLLRGPGDGVSDSIPAMIGKKQPARLADGEFVVPARIVSELGNGSTEAGARKLYAMMDRIQKARGKTVGKGKVAKNSRSEKYLPA
jgi:hypothetical protein